MLLEPYLTQVVAKSRMHYRYAVTKSVVGYVVEEVRMHGGIRLDRDDASVLSSTRHPYGECTNMGADVDHILHHPPA
jgi:hypothetical protein